jgi:ABC-type transporter Mla subunit MlaD
MGADNTEVDLLSLEDFYKTLDNRLNEANAVLTALTTTLAGKVPALGTFQDATGTSSRYHTLYEQHLDRAHRLVRAVTAAKTATATIMANYRTAEARNHANAKDIASILGDVGTELNGEPADA